MEQDGTLAASTCRDLCGSCRSALAVLEPLHRYCLLLPPLPSPGAAASLLLHPWSPASSAVY